MRKDILNKKYILIITIVIAFLIIAGSIIYLGYGTTMINPDNEKSIVNHLSSDKNKPINIIEKKKYKDYFVILYTDPTETEKNKYASHLQYYVKHKYYKNRYKLKAESGGDQTQIMVHFLQINDLDKSVCFIGNAESKETKCSIFEYDENLHPIRKLDELDVPQTPYIFVKEYELENEYNNIVVYDGDISLKELIEE